MYNYENLKKKELVVGKVWRKGKQWLKKTKLKDCIITTLHIYVK